MINDYLASVVLGIVEGLTEFLPVSSTAHLRIAERLMHLPYTSSFWDMYTVVIQLGAIFALPVYFGPRIAKFCRTFPKGERGDRTIFTHPLSLTMIAFVVTAIPAWRLSKLIGEHLDSFTVIGSALLIGGAVMWAVDALFGKPSPVPLEASVPATEPDPAIVAPSRKLTDHMETMTIWQAVWIGACQILSAVFPGTSRSMSTIAAGELAGMTRPAALEFSFFLSIPTMAAATLFQLKKAIKPAAGDPFSAQHMSPHDWIVLLIGTVISFIVALAVVAWFMAWVRRRGFVPFAIYRIIVGIGVLIWLAPTT